MEMDDLKKTISDRLRKCLDLRGESQKDFSRKMGFHPSVTTRWLKGDHLMKISSLERAAAVLEVPAVYLIGGCTEDEEREIEERLSCKGGPRKLKRDEAMNLLRSLAPPSLDSYCTAFGLFDEGKVNLNQVARAFGAYYSTMLGRYKVWKAGGRDALERRLLKKDVGRPRTRPPYQPKRKKAPKPKEEVPKRKRGRPRKNPLPEG